MFDLTSRISYKNVPRWYDSIIRVCGDIPIILIGNKADLDYRKVKPSAITFHKGKRMEYFEMSVKQNFQVNEPIQWLLEKIKIQHEEFVQAEANKLRH
jgi:GTP-binding nuclear protein Ran